MKTSLRLLALLFAANACAFVPLSLARPDDPPKGYSVRGVEQYNAIVVERGTSEFTVRRLLGEPVRRLGSDTWVYDRFCVASAQSGEDRDCDTLMITFTSGKVSDITLVNSAVEKLIAANLRAAASRTRIATK